MVFVVVNAMFSFVSGATTGFRQGRLEAQRKGAVNERVCWIDYGVGIHPYRSMMDGFYSESWRQTVKFGTFIGLFKGVQLGSRIYREKDDALNLMIGGTAAGSLYRLPGALAVAELFLLLISWSACYGLWGGLRTRHQSGVWCC